MNARRILIATLMPLACVAPPASAQLDAYVRGQAAFMSNRVAEAEAAYREVLAADTLPDHQETARITLASLAWRVRRDTAAARALLMEGEANPRQRVASLLEHARMLQAFGEWAAAQALATRALAVAVTPADSDRATVALGAAVTEPALRRRLGWDPEEPSATLSPDVVRLLGADVAAHPGEIAPARLLMAAAALTNNGPLLLAGWRSYFLFEVGDTMSGPLAGPRGTLAALLGGASDSAIPAAARVRVVEALADSRMFVPAAILAMRDGAADPRERELAAYSAFLEGTRRATDEFYRRTALRTGDAGAWRDSLNRLGGALWPQLAWDGAPPAYDWDRLVAQLDRRFGAIFLRGQTGGYEGLHFGHRVVEERRTVTQYGRTAQVRFTEIDAIVSNGFLSWAWDGRSADGGWNEGDRVVQVRPEYLAGPINAWRSLADPAERRRFDDRIAADSAADIVRGRTAPVSYFPSVGRRMQRAAWTEVRDSLSAAGVTGRDLEATFERLISRDIQESSIFAHEGRHAIDKGLGSFGAAELEFHAKLSQVVFAPRPRLGIPTIVAPSVGDPTPHGQADARVMRGLLSWMTAHATEIRGFDPSAPLLPQLPLLSDAQLRAACRSLDPLASNE